MSDLPSPRTLSWSTSCSISLSPKSDLLDKINKDPTLQLQLQNSSFTDPLFKLSLSE